MQVSAAGRGSILGLAVLAALVGSIPAAARAFRHGGSALFALIVATAIVLPFVSVGLTVSRAAGRGYRLVTGNTVGPTQAAVVAIFVGFVGPIMLALGAVLKDGTNHRGLGGATFGVLSLICVVAVGWVATRVVATARWLVARGLSDRLVAIFLALVAVAPTALLSVLLFRKPDGSPASHLVTASVIDGLLLTVVSVAALSLRVSDRFLTLVGRIGPGSAAALVVAGAFWLMLSAPHAAAMRKGGGLAPAVIGRLERWTDRDHDGAGSHFGGLDCDDGDAQRFPGAADTPGDGVDQDCDGRDQPLKEEAGPVESPQEQRSVEPPIRGAESAPGDAPHIVMVTLESLRADRMSLYGYGKDTTPNFTRLADKSLVFDHAFALASDPQRAVMPFFSGQSFAETPRDRREWPTLKSEADTVAERLAAAGYETRGISSFQWLSRERGYAQGFDEFVEAFREEHPERGVTGPLAVQSFRAMVEKLGTPAKPQFLWVHLFDAHEEWKRHDGLDFGRGDGGAYDSEVAFVDRLVGQITDAIAASPLADKTLVVLHGTYGESLGERSKAGARHELTNEHVRVPLIMFGPGVAPGRVTDRAVSVGRVTDLMLARAGVSKRGDDLAAAPSGEAPPVLLETKNRRGIVVFPWKLIAVDRKGKERLLLFNLANDPTESKDQSEAQPALLRELAALLDASIPKKRVTRARR